MCTKSKRRGGASDEDVEAEVAAAFGPFIGLLGQHRPDHERRPHLFDQLARKHPIREGLDRELVGTQHGDEHAVRRSRFTQEF